MECCQTARRTIFAPPVSGNAPPCLRFRDPKIQAIQVALEQENQRRGPAMGAMGWISLGGDLQLSVAIRTAVATGGRAASRVRNPRPAWWSKTGRSGP